MSVQGKIAVSLAGAILVLLLSDRALADRYLGALEKFERSSLTVSYISKPRKDGTRYAYILDPENYVHRVEVGDYLGKEDGRIAEIKAKEIVVIELVKVGGDVKEQAATLTCGWPCRKN